MNYNDIINLIEHDMCDVDVVIHEQLNSKVFLVNKVIRHIIFSNSKRIRPILVILVAKALRYKGSQHSVVAALIEFIHTATLLHDDVVDNAQYRRGKSTANVLFGNAVSVLVGDFIYTRAFQVMLRLKSLGILSLMSNAVNVIAEGEVFQLMMMNDTNITVDDYMNIVYSKTARLFEVASHISAIVGNATTTQQEALKDYGRYLGTAFQLIDDLLDYCADQNVLGKNVGMDLRSGKLTLPLLHAMQHSTSVQLSLIKKAIKQKENGSVFNIVFEIINQCGSLEYTRECAQIEINKAISCLNTLTPSPYRNALESIANFVVERGL